ncbi:hypothetical protein H4R26_004165 [Coemansia thaxteri]|uniref:non-specific serine/threonine protein kinase n=1 Tax=Coemansia thaxteri TaxID=2663907 RepID=A0A9W8BFF0_9FUNG|nr:hypothetical protein H4R26_004165 [Coemansia thaxteri]
MTASAALPPSNAVLTTATTHSKHAATAPSDVRRHTSTSSQHSDYTLCNEPMHMPPAPQGPLPPSSNPAVAAAASASSSRRNSAEEPAASPIAHAIAASAAIASPRVEKRPSLMQRFLGSASSAAATNGSKRVSPPPSITSSASGNRHQRRGSEASTTFEQKYGTCSRECIGRGATAVVRVAYKQHRDGPQVYAIKRFRKQRANETEREYIKKLTSEYCISSSVHHKNVVSTLDLIQDPQKNWCQVMEYCPGGDLYTAIRDGAMGLPEEECCFKQMCEGIAHLHSLGVFQAYPYAF